MNQDLHQARSKIACLVLALSCSALAAPQVYQATGVQHRSAESDADYHDIASVTSEILPEITSAFQQLSSTQGRANPSEPSSIQNTLSAFIPLSRRVLLATAKAEGRTVSQEQLDRLNAAENVMPSIFKFMEEMRQLSFDSRSPGRTAASASPANRNYQQATGVLTPDNGDYRAMAAATLEVLPEMTAIFKQLGNDPGRSDPNDPEYVQRVIMAFMPFSKRALLAAAKAEGRTVQQEELERLEAAEAVMPAVFKFMDSLRQSDFFGTGSNAAFRSGDSSAANTRPVGTAFESPRPSSLDLIPASQVAQTAVVSSPTKLQSTFEETISKPQAERVFPLSPSKRITSPVTTYVSLPSHPVVQQQAPNYPEVSHVSVPQIYQSFIPAVPSPAYYTYSTSFGRR